LFSVSEFLIETMKRTIISVIAILIHFYSFGQNSSPVDSLLAKLKVANEDTLKVELLLRLFNPLITNDHELAMNYTQQALILSEKLSFDKGMAAAYQRMGIYWSYKGNVSKAREHYYKAIEIHQRLDKPVIAATLVHNLGHLYQEQGIYDSALFYGEKASKIFLEHSDSLKYGSSLDLLASVHEEMGNYYLSLKYATEAAQLFHKYHDELREADALMKVGSSYGVYKEYRRGIEYYESAVKLYRKHNDLHWENYATQKIARSYLAIGELDKADSIINYSIHLADSLGLVQMVAEGYDIKGEILYENDQYKRALEYFKSALDINKDAQDSTFNATVQIAIGRCYQKLGLDDLALQAYQATLPITIAMDVKENLRTTYKNMSELYEKKGNTHMSFETYKKYVAVKDSIYVNEKSMQFADMQTKYDTERKERDLAIKEKEITILEQKNEIQELLRMRLIVTLIVVVVFAVLGFYTLWLRLKRNKLQQQVETQMLEHELDLKKRELTTHTLHIIQKNELLENLQSKVAELSSKEKGASYHEITRLISTNRLIEKDWQNFKSVFEQVHPDFFSKLKSKYLNISSNEMRMAAMMKMNLNTKEMASILNITPESVKKARHRLRKKMELEPEASVSDYLMSF